MTIPVAGFLGVSEKEARKLMKKRAVREAYTEALHPRNALGRWIRKPGLLHAFKHVAEGAKGSYEIEQSGKVWAARKNGMPFGLARTLGRAKEMVGAHDSDEERDWRSLLEDAYKGGGHMHEVWGGDPATMQPGEFEAARERLLALRDSIPTGSLLERDLRGMLEASIWQAGQDRQIRDARRR